MSTDTGLKPFRNEGDLKQVLNAQYLKQIKNYFGNDQKALAFLSAVVAATQRLPRLLECTPVSVINSFMVMAQLGLMPSGVSGEAYVIPYENNKKIGNNWQKVLEAQFQLGYQGLVTLFYRAGVKQIAAEVVYEHDKFTYVNGVVHHEPDVFSDDRGAAKGAYVVVTLPNGGVVSKVMSKSEIMGIAEKFSKSYQAEKKDKSPWMEANDPQLWMWKKTVLKQVAKLVPKNEVIVKAIAEDNKDSIIADRLDAAKEDSQSLTMGNLLKDENNKDQKGKGTKEGEAQPDAPEGDAPAAEEGGGLDTIQLG